MGKRATPPLQTPTTIAAAQPTATRDIVTQTTTTAKSTIAATPTTFIITSRPQAPAPSPATVATTTSVFPFIRTPGVQPTPEPRFLKRKLDATQPIWLTSGSHSPASVGGATNGSHFVSPPTTPDSPGQLVSNNTTKAPVVDPNDDVEEAEEKEEEEEEEDEVGDDELEEGKDEHDGLEPIAFSRKRGSSKRKIKSPSTDNYDPADPDDELNRPSVLTLRPWEEEDGTMSMVQDYRILIHGRLHVGKIQTEW
jgi:hypothetical protein